MYNFLTEVKCDSLGFAWYIAQALTLKDMFG